MVYLRRWDAFVLACKDMYEHEPVKTRYCIRWRHSTGLLVLKVTDDTRCIKFKTQSSVFLNRFEQLNKTMIASMLNKKTAAASLSATGNFGSTQLQAKSAQLQEQQSQLQEQSPQQQPEGTSPAFGQAANTSAAGSSSAPSKKKKKNKKK
ncbi:hypothetical protein OIO90_006588 [Microbotryomycetes sp. JL221]|nr:hypothetical protein OIO90_006588 [Microbotryomycetes sp. JL221]